MAKKVTRRQADAVFALVEKRYADWLEGEPKDSLDYPQLVENYKPYWRSDDSETVPWAIVWEPGPFEWAYRFCMGGYDAELAALAADAMGREKARAGDFTERPAPLVPGVFMEPGCTFIVCLYPGSLT